MAVPYSLDLRRRVLADVIGGSPIRAIAARFGVSPSFVSKLHKRYRRTGSVSPDKQGGDYRSHRMEAHGGWIIDTVAATPDITLVEMRRGLAGRGLDVSASTVWRFFERHGMSFKKRPRMPPSRNATT
jgi:transposase